MTDATHFVEIALLILVTFVAGALVGRYLRTLLQGQGMEAALPAARHPETQEPSAPVERPEAAEWRLDTLSAPRDGKKDNLKKIKGIGPKIESMLNELGIYHYDQIASWGPDTVKWLDEHLSFKGRIEREKWVEQAHELSNA